MDSVAGVSGRLEDRVAFVTGAARGLGRHGAIDILVNNAGVAQPAGPVVAPSDETVEPILAVNVRGVVNCSRAAARAMIERRRGRIINTASQAGHCASPDWAIYSASKAAVIALTEAMALELAPYDGPSTASAQGRWTPR